LSLTAARRVAISPALLAAGLLLVGAADAIVLGLTTGYFGAGYNSPALRGVTAVAGFVAGGAVLDTFLLTAVFAVAVQVGRVFRLDGIPRLAFASALTLFLPVAFDVVSHRLHRVFGQVLGFDAMIQLAGGHLGDAALEALTEAPAAALLLVFGLLAISGAVRLARRSDLQRRGRLELLPPSRTGLVSLLVASAVGGGAILTAAATHAPVLSYGFDHKASGQLLGLVIRLATDIDRDGFGLLSRPPDVAPLDASRHPFAVELPANGIDENGVGGDLPDRFQPQQPAPVPDRLGPRRPSFLLVFLESFRGDLVGRRLRGREVTPVLNRLAREGASSDRTYAHTPLTWPSRAQLFQGRVSATPGARTLIDDFHDLGYRVGYFSGQNDLHGGSDALVGFERADAFYDARADRNRRTSRTALPVSLQVSASSVLEQVRAYLDATAGDPKPLFLYVNLVDNHYPYHHDGIDRLLDVDPVTRSEIRPENAQRVFETYLQASAHVDRAIGELVALWGERMGEAPLLVTADHGQSFYEDGVLGHGQSLDANQSRVPLILLGIGGTWPEPLGLADLRGLLLSHLFEAPGRARFAVDPARRVFQYVGPLERPYLVGLRGWDRSANWAFSKSEGHEADDAGAGIRDAEELLPVFWTWERWQAERLGAAPQR
jgi:hypothetical protein